MIRMRIRKIDNKYTSLGIINSDDGGVGVGVRGRGRRRGRDESHVYYSVMCIIELLKCWIGKKNIKMLNL